MEVLKNPVIVTSEDLEKILGEIWPGGASIIENRANLGIEFIIHAFLEYSKHSGIPLVIEDILDTYPIYFMHLKMMGVPVEEYKAKVIKVGGSQRVCNAIEEIRFNNEPNIYWRKLKVALQKLGDEKYIHLVLGLERLLSLQDDIHTMYAFLSPIKEKLGDNRGINVYPIEVSVLEGLGYNPLPILEDIGTSVAELKDEGELIRIKLRKSALLLILNREYFMISPWKTLGWAKVPKT